MNLNQSVMVRDYHGCKIASMPERTEIEGSDGWEHAVFVPNGTRVGELLGGAITLADAIKKARAWQEANPETDTSPKWPAPEQPEAAGSRHTLGSDHARTESISDATDQRSQ